MDPIRLQVIQLYLGIKASSSSSCYKQPVV